MNTTPCVSPESAYTPQELRNRDVVLDFHESGVNRRDWARALRHLDERCIQHDPNLADGPEGFREYFSYLDREHPDFRVEIRRIFIEGDMVALHVRALNGPTRNGEAGVNIYRLENGKIVEHWDVIQPIPDRIPHANTMF
ncbi:MAG TPA: ester cyclase [Steroidobacteraceae bacterium]|nr:ester cyclase [Steroidobacteraceae bacterium]